VSKTFNEMLASPYKDKWWLATMEVYNAQMQNGTWELVPRPPDANIMKLKWLWKVKKDEIRRVRHKARLVILGCMEVYGVDYDETFAPVVRLETLRFILLYAGTKGMRVRQYNFVTAFLNAGVDCSLYTE
jgi:hypothetical protein